MYLIRVNPGGVHGEKRRGDIQLHYVRRLITGQFEKFHLNLPSRVDCEDPRAWDVNAAVGQSVRDTVAKAGVEWIHRGLPKKSTNVPQAGHLEYFRFAHDHFPVSQKAINMS